MINKMLSTYGFDTLAQFLQSMLPSSKYGLATASVSSSLVTGIISQYLGLTPLLVVVMGIAVFGEMLTGIYASHKSGKHFESFRFSRGILKICVWCVIFFIFNGFALEMSRFSGWQYLIAAAMFKILHASSMVWFVIENGTSILENQAVIDGKPKTQYVEAVRALWSTFVSAMKGKIK